MGEKEKYSNLCSILMEHKDRCKKRPTAGFGEGVRRRGKDGLVMRNCQCLETNLKQTSDLRGRRRRICDKRSSIEATISADVLRILILIFMLMECVILDSVSSY